MSRAVDFTLPGWSRKKVSDRGEPLVTCPVCGDRGEMAVFLPSGKGNDWSTANFTHQRRLAMGLFWTSDTGEHCSIVLPTNGATPRYHE